MQKRFPFLSLPTELITVTCNKLRLDDLKQLRLSCQDLEPLLSSFVLRKISISPTRKQLKQTFQDLGQSDRIKEFTQEIQIRIIGCRPWPFEEDPPIILEEEETMKCIFEVLSSLNEVVAVTYFCVGDPIWLHETIMRAIRTYDHLRHLAIRGTADLDSAFGFDSLVHLESISVADVPFHHNTRADFFHSLAKQIASSFKLTSIAFSSSSFSSSPCLHQLFSQLNDEAPPFCLRNLELNQCYVLFDEVTIPYLRYLTSLTLIGVLHKGRDPKTTLKTAASDDDVWASLPGSGIQIENLKHDTITKSLIKYLSTYSGLKSLDLRHSLQEKNSELDEELSHNFFFDALPNHVETLETLSLHTPFEGYWCFGGHNLSTISKFIHLGRLSMSIIISNYTKELIIASRWSDFFESDMDRLLDTVITRLPLLQYLSLSPADLIIPIETEAPGSYRNVASGMMNIVDSIRNYKPPRSCQYLPQIIAVLQGEIACFKVAEDPVDGTLRYIESIDVLNPPVAPGEIQTSSP